VVAKASSQRCSSLSGITLHVALQRAPPSQVSPASTTPLPQRGGQSLSRVESAPSGQQPSPPVGAVIGSWVHTALQLAALPLSSSRVQASLSAQAASSAGQGVLDFGSQLSPRSLSITPSPQLVEQSASVDGAHALGQQPSRGPQLSTISTHCAWHAEPFNARRAHGASSGQACGHAPG
jgi:hypothetical protein